MQPDWAPLLLGILEVLSFEVFPSLIVQILVGCVAPLSYPLPWVLVTTLLATCLYTLSLFLNLHTPNLKMKSARSSETSISTFTTTKYHNPEIVSQSLLVHNLKSVYKFLLELHFTSNN
jgi:hypothetical protein